MLLKTEQREAQSGENPKELNMLKVAQSGKNHQHIKGEDGSATQLPQRAAE